MGVECRYELAQAAYVKLALHALKHPAAAVNGLLVGRLASPAASPAVVSVVDAVPLSHQPHLLPLLPTLELALTLVEDHFQPQGLAVVGYYHANARRDDADLPAIAKHVGDHIFRYFPRAAVLLLDNVKLEEVVKGNSRDAVVQEPEAQPHKVEPATEILFLCSYDNCGKTFVDVAALRKHAHVHGERQYVCQDPGCGKVPRTQGWNLDRSLGGKDGRRWMPARIRRLSFPSSKVLK